MTDTTDFLVVGSGIAALSFALEASRLGRVTLVTKRGPEAGSTWLAQGGISAALGADDSVDLHVRDTLTAGDGLCDEAAARALCGEGPSVIEFLRAHGCHFSGTSEQELGLEGGHSRRRVVHAGDATGAHVGDALLAAVRACPDVEILARQFAVDVIVEPRWPPGPGGRAPRCLGAYVLDEASGAIRAVGARATVLATGGSGKVYLYTTNADVATGDGLAIAYRAGCRVSNLEFYQFHPTCLYHAEAKSFLVSEAVRGEGGVLVDAAGRRIMEGVHPLRDLAPRDIVARAIDRHMKETGADCVFLDITHRDEAFLAARFPTIHRRCLELGLDMARHPIPVVPAAHYQCGGVVTDLDGRTDVAGLFAVGEVACTGLHGANRLASNSLLEGVAVGRRAAAALARDLPPLSDPAALPEWSTGAAVPMQESVLVAHTWDEIRRFMWNYVGIFRSDARLERARHRIELTEQEIREYYWRYLPTTDLLELRNLAIVARLVVESAIWRKESRGLHYTITHPEKLEAWRRPSVLRRGLPGSPPEIAG